MRVLGGAIAQSALKRCAETAHPPLGGGHPRVDLPWRLVPYMLRMPTLELGDPVMLGVFMEAGDPPLHGSTHESPRRPLSDPTRRTALS